MSDDTAADAEKPARAKRGAKAAPATVVPDAQPAERKGSKSSAGKSTAGKSGVAKPASKERLAARASGENPAPHSARKSKAAEVKAAGTAKAVNTRGTAPKPEEEMPKQTPIRTKGEPKPAASKAADEGKPTDGTSSATAGKTEKMQAEASHAGVAPTGRGRRKAAARHAAEEDAG